MPRCDFKTVLVSLLAATYLAGGQTGFHCSCGEESSQKKILSGKLLHDALQQRRGLNTAGTHLRRVVADLRNSSGISVLLDRRIDPSTPVAVATDYVTMQEILETLAGISTQTAVSFGDQYVLIGPSEAVGRLRTLTETNRLAVQHLRREMNAATYRKLVEPRDVSWPDLAEPRQLLMDAASAVGVTVENPDAVPHDLWSAADLPSLPFSAFATLVLNQFDLTFELSAEGSMKLVPVARTITIEKRHRVSSRDKDKVAQRFKAAFPDLSIAWNGSTAVISATVETHEALSELIRGAPTGTVAAASIRDRLFTMKAPPGTPVGKLIATFEASGVPIRIAGKSDAEMIPLLEKTVEFDLTQTPGVEFFEKVFEGWGAEIIVDDDEVVLTFQ